MVVVVEGKGTVFVGSDTVLVDGVTVPLAGGKTKGFECGHGGAAAAAADGKGVGDAGNAEHECETDCGKHYCSVSRSRDMMESRGRFMRVS